MYTILKRYGKILEVTQFEKKSQKVRLHSSYQRNDVHGKRRIDSLRRSRQICVRRVLSAIEDFGTPMFATLTFEGDASDAYYASEVLSRFQRRLLSKYPQSCSLFIPELSPKGRIHFHGLLFGLPIEWGNIRKGGRVISWGSESSTRNLANLWAEGFVDLTQTDGSTKLAYYTAKYITKDGGETLFNGMRLLRFSRNFPKEIVIKDKLICDKVVDGLKDKLPFQEWQGFTHFCGNISKLKYLRD